MRTLFGQNGKGSASPAACRVLLVGTALIFMLPFPKELSAKARLAANRQLASFRVAVNDENGLAVPLAQVTLTEAHGQRVVHGATNYAGRVRFDGLVPGVYRLEVENEGFYTVKVENIQVGKTESTEVTLDHIREYHQRVDVKASPGSINPAKTSSTETLNENEIMKLPFSVPRDIRYALPLMPGVLQDANGQIHINGSPTREILDELDGFNITDPVSGFFDARVPVAALRSVTVMGSRYPAQDGKAVGGLLDLATGMGDDRYRFSGTDFLPSFSTHGGLHIKSWLPRGSFSGPLKRGKAWFLLAPEYEYNSQTINDLPPSADRTSNWRLANLAKAQVNLTESNILTGTILVNNFRSFNAGLSRFDPLETTTNLSESIDHVSVKDQSQLSNGALMEYGVAFSRFYTLQVPKGSQTYVMTPEGTSGNYFARVQGRSQRWQMIGNLVAPTFSALGNHEFKVGIDLDRLAYVASFNRHEILILREDGTLSREVTFPGNPSVLQTNFETGAYAQDHWSISNRLVIDPGVRLDWDQIVPGARVSPRLAASFLPTAGDKTKIVAGAGIYYDQSSLDLYTRPQDGTRIDTFYGPSGQVEIMPPVASVFQTDRQDLKAPWFFNWSVGVEHQLPKAIFLRLEYLQKRGHRGWTYIHPCGGSNGCFSGQYILESRRRDRYHSLDLSIRRRFKGGHIIFASYVRSMASSNAVLDFNLDSPYFSPQLGGPLPWNTPNRFLSWGILPLVDKVNLVYTLDWHDGFPFSVVNQNQELVGPPDRLRFPDYFSLNLALETRVSLFGFRWEVRGGFDDITNRHNPNAVDNNIDSPSYLTFGSADRRALTGQIRLLGRK